MSTFDLRVQCPSGTCLRPFTIRLKILFRGRKIRIECPGCFGKFNLNVPTLPKTEAGMPTGDPFASVSTIEVVLKEIFDIDLKAPEKRN